MKLLRTVPLALLLAMAWAAPARATPIKYEFWATLSGQIGTTSFFDRSSYFEIYGDTDNAGTFSNANTNGYLNYIRPGSLSGTAVTIDGIGKANLQLFMLMIANPNDYCQCVGLRPSSSTGGDILDLFQTPFTLANPYDLKTSTELITGRVVTFPIQITVNTSLGALRLDSGYGGSFRATVVPLPAAAGLFGAALLVLAGLRSQAPRVRRTVRGLTPTGD
jgi:hypothetical protein